MKKVNEIKKHCYFRYLIVVSIVIFSFLYFFVQELDLNKNTQHLASAAVTSTPPQGVAPIFYVMHDTLYSPPAGAGALGGWFWVTWKQIEGQAGAYNWDRIDSHLAQEANKSTTLKNGQVIKKPIAISIIILPNVRQSGVPDYVYKNITGSSDINVWKNSFSALPKLNNQVCTTDTCAGCECNCSPDLRPPWENAYFQERFKAMVKAFGDRYNNDSRINSVWIATGLYGENVTSGMGGCTKGPDCSYQNACRFNYSPSGIFGNWLIQKDIVGTYRSAFPTKPLFIINTAPTGRFELTARALQVSPPVGLKHNALEFDLPDQNGSDNDQWRTINYYWDEVERRGLEGLMGFEHFFAGAPPHTYWALLAGLARRMTLIDLPTGHLDVLAQMQKSAEANPNSSDYFPMWSFTEDHFGRNAVNTPSVWAVLRDTQYSTGEPGDWEFFLYRPENIPGQYLQRQSGQDKTVVVKNTELPAEAKAQIFGRGYFRRTDQATQNYYMYFHIDERWPALQTIGFDIEVTYLDKGTDAWSLKYGPATDQEIIIRKTNTNKFIRKKFELPNISFTKINTAGDNFRIDCRADGDETIHMVRVMPKSWQAPNWNFSGSPPLPPSDTTSPAAPTGITIQ